MEATIDLRCHVNNPHQIEELCCCQQRFWVLPPVCSRLWPHGGRMEGLGGWHQGSQKQDKSWKILPHNKDDILVWLFLCVCFLSSSTTTAACHTHKRYLPHEVDFWNPGRRSTAEYPVHRRRWLCGREPPWRTQFFGPSVGTARWLRPGLRLNPTCRGRGVKWENWWNKKKKKAQTQQNKKSPGQSLLQHRIPSAYGKYE